MVLQKANAPIVKPPRSTARVRERWALLRSIVEGRRRALVSSRLLHEYQARVKPPRNDLTRAFVELAERALTLGRGEAFTHNWASPWDGSRRDAMNRCRFPPEDEHVLRTAVRDGGSTIFTEEERMLRTNGCLYRRLDVRVAEP